MWKKEEEEFPISINALVLVLCEKFSSIFIYFPSNFSSYRNLVHNFFCLADFNMTRIFEDVKEFNYFCPCLCYLHACFCILNWNTGGLIKWIWRQKCFVAGIVKDFFGLIGGSCALFDDILLIVCRLLYYPYRSMGFSKGCL